MNRYILIGGSAGSFQSIVKILNQLPENYAPPVFLCLHRLKHVRGGFVEALSIKSKLKVVEPEDKDSILPGQVYLVPANYHMYLEVGNSIALSTEEAKNHSRPSIDLMFSSAAFSFREKVVGILLSGANKDGAEGMKDIKLYGGTTIIQDPKEAAVPVMPQAAKNTTEIDHVFTIDEIIDYLHTQNF